MFNCVFPIVNARDSWKMSCVKTLKGQGHSLITFFEVTPRFCFLCELAKKWAKSPKYKNRKKTKAKSYLLRFLSWARVTIQLPPSCLMSYWEGEMPAERCVRLKRLVCLYLSKIKYIDPQNTADVYMPRYSKNFNLKRIRYCYIGLLKLTIHLSESV